MSVATMQPVRVEAVALFLLLASGLEIAWMSVLLHSPSRTPIGKIIGTNGNVNSLDPAISFSWSISFNPDLYKHSLDFYPYNQSLTVPLAWLFLLHLTCSPNSNPGSTHTLTFP